MARKEKPLTQLQKNFAHQYVGAARFNGVKAAELAGYKGKYNSLAVQAHDNLKLPNVIAYINSLLTDAGMGSEEIKARIADRSRGVDVIQFYHLEEREVTITTKSGASIEKTEIVLVPDLDAIKRAGVGHLIHKIYQSGGNVVIEWEDSAKMLLEAGKIHGLFVERIKDESDGPRYILFGDMDEVAEWEAKRSAKKSKTPTS